MSLFSDLLDGVLAIDRTADAIEFRGRWYTWGDLADMLGAIRTAIGALDLPEDARVGVMLRNRPATFAAVLAAVSGRTCMVSINPLLPDVRLIADLARLRLPVVIGETADIDRPGVLDSLREAGSAVIELTGTLDAAVFRDGFERPTGAVVKLAETGGIIEMLTSGTTGPPKRVLLKRRAFEKSFIGALSYEKGHNLDDPPKLRSGTTILSSPMTHIGGLWGALTSIVAGRKSCLMEKFSVESWRDAIVRHRPKVAGAVPAALRMILDANIPKEDLASLVAIRTGAAPLDPMTTAEFWDRYGIPVLQNYGATEFSGAIAGWTLPDFLAFRETKATSVGRFQPGVAGRVIAPDTGKAVAPGVEGVLEVRSEQFGNGGAWLRTTDRAMIDEDGFLFILGRADNAIVRGGFKIHADDVIAVLEQHPAVREAVVVGVEDKRLGAVPVAAIILKAGADRLADGELAAFARERLLPYQVPTRFLFVDEVPRTESMKPMLPQVRELFATAPEAA